MANENHGLPPEVHIDHWNEATNIYMVVIVVSLWFFVYLRKNRGRIARMLVMRKQETEEQANRRQEELKQVRFRQQLDMYYKARKWDQAKQKQERGDHHIDMLNM
ncbi:small integral membrane protein 19-like [Amphiura filiformis]|uniref:small integral membrane protein 19-like n=1 Tax=Amphiura filiformis TaxID=82378 RepID=UPI003B217C90